MSRHSVLEANYHFEYDIGQWQFGTIQAVREKESGSKRICKTVPKIGLLDMQRLRSELNRLQSFPRHPHVCGLLEVLEDEMCLHLIMEDCEGEDVSELLSRLDEGNWLDEQTVAVYVRQALIATAHCHSQGVAHGDLRTSSLGLTTRLPDASVKVMDFGLSNVFDPNRLHIRQHPSPFVAPEVLSGQVDGLHYPGGDVWSIGAAAHHLLVNRPPGSTTSGRVVWTLAGGATERPRLLDTDGWGDRSQQACDFVQRLLCPAGERLTAAQALQHPWIMRVGPIGSAKFMRTPGGAEEAIRQYQRRATAYTLSVLMVPSLMRPQDFENEKATFVSLDTDRDGFVSRAIVGTTLRGRGIAEEAVADALDVADAPRTGELDLCSFAVAALLTQHLPRGQNGNSDAVQRLEKRFLEVFADSRQPTLLHAASIKHRLRTNNTAQQLERYARVRYEHILSYLPDSQQPIDMRVLLEHLAQANGRGTPLEIPPEEVVCPTDDDEPSLQIGPKAALEIVNGLFNLNFVYLFNRCTTVKRNPSPHSVRV